METEFISQRLKLQHLKIVMAVVESGSMAKAAKTLAISQPVVSKAVADLEKMLGLRLFDRSPQGVEPTLYGRALLKRSVAIFDDLKTSVDEIKFLADPTAGELRIGSTEPLLAGLGAAVMKRLWEKYPRIAFHVAEADSATLLGRDLVERRVELALVPLARSVANPDLAETILFKDRLRVLVGRNSRWAHRRKVTLAELIDEPWCVVPSAIGSLIADAFSMSSLQAPRIVLRTTTAHLSLQLIASGSCVGHFGDLLLDSFMDRFAVKRLPIELPVQPFAVAIVTVRNRTISPVGRLFIDCAREVVEQLTERRSRMKEA